MASGKLSAEWRSLPTKFNAGIQYESIIYQAGVIAGVPVF
jgi:hypothetical protein